MGGRKNRVNLGVILPLALLRGPSWNAKRMQLDGMQIIVLLASGSMKLEAYDMTIWVFEDFVLIG